MNFYVYEDTINRRIRVHVGSCTYCKEGNGMNATRLSENRWHGPFATLEEAQVLAQSLKRKNTRTCLSCLVDS